MLFFDLIISTSNILLLYYHFLTFVIPNCPSDATSSLSFINIVSYFIVIVNISKNVINLGPLQINY